MVCPYPGLQSQPWGRNLRTPLELDRKTCRVRVFVQSFSQLYFTEISVRPQAGAVAAMIGRTPVSIASLMAS